MPVRSREIALVTLEVAPVQEVTALSLGERA